MDPWLQFGLNMLSGLVIAVVTSIVSVRLSLRRFYSQHWWERKADAYSEIVESLYYMKWRLEILLEEIEEYKEISEKTQEYINDRYLQAKRSIRKAQGVGAFIISERAVKSLTKMLRRIEVNKHESKGHFGQQVYSDLCDVDECLSEMRSLAKEDLKMTRSSWWRLWRL
jgi:hypothetical protein